MDCYFEKEKGLFVLKDDRFKVNRISIVFFEKIKPFTNTLNALIPSILQRGNNKYKDLKEINLILNDMYGANLYTDVFKKGDVQVITFNLNFIADRFTKENMLERALQFLYDIIYGPIIYGGGFDENVIKQEKENLKLLIESRINDKTEYALDRCIEEMFAGDNYALFEKGNVEDLELINKDNVYEQYIKLINAPRLIIITSEYSVEDIQNKVKETFGLKTFEGVDIDLSINKPFSNTRYVDEEMEVNQGKLSIGIRTNTHVLSGEYYTVMLLNGILGVSPKSKLFENVRERASLCYYIYSRLDRFKPIMVISSGIEVENYQKALDIILEQIEDMKRGQISQEEYESTIKYYYTAFKSIYDNPNELMNYYLNQVLIGEIKDPIEVFNKIKSIPIEDIAEFAKKLEVDTVYFLKNRGEE